MNIERGGEKEEIDWGGWEGKDGRKKRKRILGGEERDEEKRKRGEWRKSRLRGKDRRKIKGTEEEKSIV